MPPTRSTESLQQRKAKLRTAFLSQLPERVREARAALDLLKNRSTPGPGLDALYVAFHTIKGSGASFGFATISRIAQTGQERVDHLRKASDTPGMIDEYLPLMEELINDLEREATAQHTQTTPAETSFELPERPSEPTPAAAACHAITQFDDRGQRLIYVCDDDPGITQQLSSQLACFGYNVQSFTALADVQQAIRTEKPAAIIMDIVFPEGNHAGPGALASIFQEMQHSIPTIFISSADDFSARLQAIRAQGLAYCTKPVKTVEILEFLDELTNPRPPEPINVLVVDDDRALGQYHAAILESAGMNTRTVSKPEQVLDILQNFAADLVLMDLYMPVCSGPEMARILRQMPGYVSLPIIYVSSETDARLQRNALSEGADGFLTKPIDPENLISEVRLRAERMRILHSLMVRDSLTGLFNHNTIMQFLEVAVANALRFGSPLSFAMIDIDHFKSVNDTHGHPAGDQVIVALSQTLRLRLREDDVVGRYGGEEFCVILNRSNAEQSRRIIDALRDSFANVKFFADGVEFQCTFSAGIASLNRFDRPETLTEAADRALYRAKLDGRNQVVIAKPEDITAPTATTT